MADLTAEESLERAQADFPLNIAGCLLLVEPGNEEGGRPLGALYHLRSRGLLADQHETLFRAVADVAEITGITKSGPFFGHEPQAVPIEKHVEVLRELGFNEMIFPDGRRYEIATSTGVRRLRR